MPSRPQVNDPAGQSAKRRAGVDLAWLVVACVIIATVVMQTRAITQLWDITPAWEHYELNGLFALLILTPVAATIFSRRRYQEAIGVRRELAELSLHDTLTGLPNRLFLARWLAWEIRTCTALGPRPAVIFVDLDRFKIVNDTYGHETGDELMVAVAARLRAFLEPEDRIVRYGGDEFVIIRPQTPTPVAAESMAAALITEIERPFALGTDTVRISASIGVTMVENRDVTPEDVVRQADIAMYAAKSVRSGTWQRFDPGRHGNLLAPLSAETRLAKALSDGEFRLVYQPVVDLGTGRVSGVEALLRWDDPERGTVSPAEFIPVLEETGLIVPVGAWVLTEGCAQAQRWRQELGDAAPDRVAINVSARQLNQVGFRERVTEALSRSGLPREQLCLEITEGALVADVGAAWTALRDVRALGVRLALDDFGTGYSSLSFVRRFLLDMLKIDKTFVDGLPTSSEDTAIVAHVISLARSLGMVVVAEGVEEPAQLTELRRLNCDLAQGYLLSRPVGPDEIAALCANPSPLRVKTADPITPLGAQLDTPPPSAPVVSPPIAESRPQRVKGGPALPQMREIRAELVNSEAR